MLVHRNRPPSFEGKILNTYRITSKRTAAALDLPQTIEADQYMTSGRFFNFYTGERFDAVVVAAIASDLVAFISTEPEAQ